MLKLAGVLLLLAGSLGMGLSFCADMKKRLLGLKEIKRMYERIYSQIDYTGEALPEICHLLEQELSPPLRNICRQVYEEATGKEGRPLPQIWEKACMEHLQDIPLKPEEKKEVARFALFFGYADREHQKRTLDGQIIGMEERIRETEGHMAEREKICMSLAVMGGLLLCVILL